MDFSNVFLRSLLAAVVIAFGVSAPISSAYADDDDHHYSKSKYDDKDDHHYKSSKYYDEDKCEKSKKYAADPKKASKAAKYAKYCKDDHDDGHHNGHSSKLVIQEIFVDQPASGQMTILGTNFGNAPSVRFGTEHEYLVISSMSSAGGIDSIVADLPADIPAGDYLVIVSSKSEHGNGWRDDNHVDGHRGADENSSRVDEYDLTVAAPADGGGGADPLITRILCDVCRALNNDSNPGLFLACGQFLDNADDAGACPIIQ